MIQSDRPVPKPELSPASAAGLARRLDRLVMAARGLRLLDLVGRIVVAAAIAAAVVAVVRRGGLSLPTPAGAVVIGIAIGVAAWAAARRWRWPDRLSTAMEIERAHPWMGERISRAVGLETADAGPPDLPGRSLAREAVVDAIAAIDGRPPVRPLDRLAALRWPLAGLLAVGLGGVAMRSFDRESEPRPIEPTVTEDSSVGNVQQALSDAGLAAAKRLADNAAAGERLAIALLGAFATAPGLPQEELSRQEREWLDATASLHESIVEAMGADLPVVARELVESRKTTGDMAGPLLLALVGERQGDRARRLRDAAEPIRANRLAAAAQSILREVKAILGAVESLGVRPSHGIVEGSMHGPADRAGLARRRLMSMIDAKPAHDAVRDDVNEGDESPADGPARGPADRVEPSPTPGEPGMVASRQPGGSAGDAAGDGGPVGGERSSTDTGIRPAAGDGGTPAWIRGRETRSPEPLVGDGLGIAGRYRAAVDGYYRRLWETQPHDGGEREGKGMR